VFEKRPTNKCKNIENFVILFTPFAFF